MISFVGLFYSVFCNVMIGVGVTLFGGNIKAAQAFVGSIHQLMSFSFSFVWFPSMTLVLVVMFLDILENGHPALAVGVLVAFITAMLCEMLLFDEVLAAARLECFNLPKWLLWIPPFVIFPAFRHTWQRRFRAGCQSSGGIASYSYSRVGGFRFQYRYSRGDSSCG
jgi:hypothetical protein